MKRLLLTAALLAIALPVLAGHDDGGTDQAWTNEMNQESYWNDFFGGECTKFEDHSGFIPATYQAAVVKDGNMVRIYEKPGPFTASGAVNPANGSHFAAPHSWVMKCKIESTTSTTLPETTTTEPEETTTTSTGSTSSTSLPSSTLPSSTTSTTMGSSTSAPPPSTPTPPTELPFTGEEDDLEARLSRFVHENPVPVLAVALLVLASGGLLVRVARD